MDNFKELCAEESHEIKGGLTWLGLAGAVVVSLCLEALFNSKSTVESIQNGYERAGELEKYL
jgi:hypothetical protein